MSKPLLAWIAVGLSLLALAGFSAWLFTLPAEVAASTAPSVPQAEYDAMLASLRPVKAGRPLVAVIGINNATETTDYLMPTGILRRADIADVVMLATGPGPVQLYPALKVEPDATIAEFDAAHPDGADYVIVPAMSRDDDPAVLAWLNLQAGKGARIIGVCAGAKVVGAAGLLDGKRATTHWYYLREMRQRTPSIQYVPDRRMVSDGNITTTTGITASMPVMLMLIEAIADRSKAEAVARDLGLQDWHADHASDAFKLTRDFATTALANKLEFWKHEEFGILLEPGMDEVSLALVADAWSRTYRSSAVAYADSMDAIDSLTGVRMIPDRSATRWRESRRLSTYPEQKPAEVLDHALEAIAARYGRPTAEVVAMQLEYPSSSPAYGSAR